MILQSGQNQCHGISSVDVTSRWAFVDKLSSATEMSCMCGVYMMSELIDNMPGLAKTHTGLWGASVSSHLQSDDALSCLHLLIRKLSLILCGFSWSQSKLSTITMWDSTEQSIKLKCSIPSGSNFYWSLVRNPMYFLPPILNHKITVLFNGVIIRQ